MIHRLTHFSTLQSIFTHITEGASPPHRNHRQPASLDDPRPWLPNLVSAGQSPGSDPFFSDAHPPPDRSRTTLCSAVIPDPVGSQPFFESSLDLTQHAAPRIVSGISATRFSPRSVTEPNYNFIEPSSSGGRGLRRAIAIAIADSAGPSLLISLGRGIGFGVGESLRVSGAVRSRDVQETSEGPPAGRKML